MTMISRSQAYQYAANAGFTGAALDEVVAIMFAESGGDTAHVNVNKSGSTSVINGKSVQVPAGTKDRGPLQINDWWNNGQSPPNGGGGALVTDAQADDPAFAFAWAYKMTGGKQPTSSSDPFKPYWVTVQNGAYKQYLTPGGGSGVTAQSSSGSNPTIQGILAGATTVATGSTAAGELAGSPSFAAGANAGASTVATGNPATFSDVVNAIQNGVSTVTSGVPDLLVHIGLFLAFLAMVIAGFLLVANQEEGTTP